MSTKTSTSTSSSQGPILSIPLLDSVARFALLYLTTLFSLDSWNAALNSPFSLPSSSQAEIEARWSRGGQGTTRSSFRLDPGGNAVYRSDGLGGRGSGTDINATPCPSCARPNVSIQQ